MQEAREVCAALKNWLVEDAYTLWWTRGADHVRGGYHESLQLDGQPADEPRRARLHPRQMWAFNLADELGWSGPAELAVRHGLDFFLPHYRREDHLYRTLVAPDGRVLDDRAVLYDQAFALLGLAAAYDSLGEDELRDTARELHEQLHRQLSHPLAGFEESNPRRLPLLSNSHMHLFEAALAWIELDHEPIWTTLAAQIVDLALTRFIDPRQGFIREFFREDWSDAPRADGHAVEPGHQFEWAWLLLRWGARVHDERVVAAGLRLIELGERDGVDRKRGAAVNSLLANGVVLDGRARLWPQTERIKAACIAAETTRQPHYWDMASQAARSLLKYLDTPLSGLWRDSMNVDGSFVEQLVPASSFYHITVAIAELEHTLKRSAGKFA